MTIKAYGIHWRLDWIEVDNFWMYGFKPKSDKWGNLPDPQFIINRCSAVYMLQDQDRQTLYVGQAKDLGNRLYAHTKNHNMGRWTHFSWFSIEEPEEYSGKPEETGKSDPEEEGASLDSDLSLNNLEALLIEAIDPPLNRKSGSWSQAATQYIQTYEVGIATTNEIWEQGQKIKKLLKDINKKIL